MILCLPIFIHQERLEWEKPHLLQRIQKLLDECILTQNVSSFTVATDAYAVAKICNKFPGVKIQYFDNPKTSPEFINQLLEVLRAEEPTQIVMGVNYRNPKLTSAVISKVIEKYFTQPEAPVIAVTEPNDHPAQLRFHYSVIDAGLLHALEPQSKINCLAQELSLPIVAASTLFPIDWRLLPRANAKEQFIPSDKHDGSVFYRKSPNLARILWLHDGPGEETKYATRRYTSKKKGLHAIQKHNGIEIVCPGLTGTNYLNMSSFSNDLNQPIKTIYKNFDQERCYIDNAGINTTGFVFSIESPQLNGEYDLERWFDPGGVLWSAHSHTLKNGEHIFGRQNLPLMYEKNSSFCIGSMKQLKKMSSNNFDGNIQGVQLQKNHSIILQSEVDCLRLHACEKLEILSQERET